MKTRSSVVSWDHGVPSIPESARGLLTDLCFADDDVIGGKVDTIVVCGGQYDLGKMAGLVKRTIRETNPVCLIVTGGSKMSGAGIYEGLPESRALAVFLAGNSLPPGSIFIEEASTDFSDAVGRAVKLRPPMVIAKSVVVVSPAHVSRRAGLVLGGRLPGSVLVHHRSCSVQPPQGCPPIMRRNWCGHPFSRSLVWREFLELERLLATDRVTCPDDLRFKVGNIRSIVSR